MRGWCAMSAHIVLVARVGGYWRIRLQVGTPFMAETCAHSFPDKVEVTGSMFLAVCLHTWARTIEVVSVRQPGRPESKTPATVSCT
jgi:hypothetical protein